MALSIYELSAPYENIMLNPPPRRPGVCATCWTFHNAAFSKCSGCADMPTGLIDAVVPITYSVGGEQMHHELRGYKDSPSTSVRARISRGLAEP